MSVSYDNLHYAWQQTYNKAYAAASGTGLRNDADDALAAAERISLQHLQDPTSGPLTTEQENTIRTLQTETAKHESKKPLWDY